MTDDALDPLIHVPTRLRIVVTLAALKDGDTLSFTRLQDMVAHLRDSGYVLNDASWDDFVATIEADRDNALFPVIDIFRGYLTAGEAFYLAIDVGSTERALAGSGIVCPPIDKELFGKYAEFFAEAGYFPNAPAR